jgi:anti-sigma factor RsiW
MSVERHPLAQLSAFIDGALAPAEHAAVQSHLDGCASCGSYVAELRGTASLIGALPDLAPSRRLVPRVAPVPAWLAPLRTMTTLASGISVFAFLATALLANVGGVATSGAAAPAPAAIEAPTSARGVQINPAAAPSAANAQDAAKAAPTSSPAALQRAPAASGAAGFSVTSGSATPPQAGARSDETRTVAQTRSAPALTSPWLWLALAIAFGIVAIGLQRRLRST